MSPEMPEPPLFMRLKDSCHFAATWARRASVAMVVLSYKCQLETTRRREVSQKLFITHC
jgi:hypothetical protein